MLHYKLFSSKNMCIYSPCTTTIRSKIPKRYIYLKTKRSRQNLHLHFAFFNGDLFRLFVIKEDLGSH